MKRARLLCPPVSPRVCSNSCPLSRWCYLSSANPLLLLLSFLPSIRVFSNESALHIKQSKFGASASVLPKNIQGWFPLELTDLILQFKGLSIVFNITMQKRQFFSAQPFSWFKSHIGTWLPEKPVLTILYKPLSAKWYISFLIHCLPNISCSYKSLFYRL